MREKWCLEGFQTVGREKRKRVDSYQLGQFANNHKISPAIYRLSSIIVDSLRCQSRLTGQASPRYSDTPPKAMRGAVSLTVQFSDASFPSLRPQQRRDGLVIFSDSMKGNRETKGQPSPSG